MPRKTLGLAAVAATLIAAPTAVAQPAVGLIGGGATDALATFDTDTPSTVTSSRGVTGLVAGERLVGIDYRWIPLASANTSPGLYGLGVNPGTGDSHVYRIDPATAVAAPVGAGFNRAAGVDYGFDFNPAVDRIRVITSGDDNYRAHPDTGAIVAPGDTTLTPAAQSISAAAYDRVNVAPTTPAGPTTLYVINPTTDQLATQGGVDSSPSPNGGATNAVGPLGVDAAPTGANFDIAYDGKAYATLVVGGTPGLYAIDKSSGAATLIGSTSLELDGLAIIPGTAQFTTTAFSNSERTNATITVTRGGSTAFSASVNYATGGGTADASDYTPASGTLTFGPGESTKSFAVNLTDDSVREDDETVGLTLSNPSNGLALGNPAATLTIVDNDGPAVVPPTPADKTAPTVTLSTVRSSYSLKAFKRGVTVRVATNEAASIEATLAAKVTKATAARAALAGAYNLELIGKKLSSGTGTRTIKLKPKSALFGTPRKSVKVKLRVVATDAAGNDRTVTKIITVKK